MFKSWGSGLGVSRFGDLKRRSVGYCTYKSHCPLLKQGKSYVLCCLNNTGYVDLNRLPGDVVRLAPKSKKGADDTDVFPFFSGPMQFT